jgi:hypothetical protein
MIDVSKLVLSLAAQEKDPALDSLKDAAKELATFAAEKGLKKHSKRQPNGGLILKVGEIALTPPEFNAEDCGTEEWIEQE